MKKIAPVLLIVVLGLALGLLIWWVTRDDAVQAPPPPPGPEYANVDFVPVDFIPVFDQDKDGQVSFEEFKRLYGTSLKDNSPPLIFHDDNNGPPLSAEQAFKKWDLDANGVVNDADMKQRGEDAWHGFQKEADGRGLKAVAYGSKWMMLNDIQLRAFDAEKAALARGEYPFAGSFWKAKYIGEWVTITDANGVSVSGFLSRTETRVFLLTADAKLNAYDPATVNISKAPADDPHNQYAAGIRRTGFLDADGNLELARHCMNWGMGAEAGMLYARVLILDPDNEEALNALGLIENDGHFTPKGN
ncbi:MAG: hypothetical protein K8I27_14470 [Planctomycetes bacterium]|nr:hypothetical protein [Planctomycetota bacterium]